MFRVTYEPPVGDPEELAETLRSLAPGQELIYHRGHLRFAPPEIRYIAGMALARANAKMVVLVQRRLSAPKRGCEIDWVNGIGTGVEYIAIGRHPPAS